MRAPNVPPLRRLSRLQVVCGTCKPSAFMSGKGGGSSSASLLRMLTILAMPGRTGMGTCSPGSFSDPKDLRSAVYEVVVVQREDGRDRVWEGVGVDLPGVDGRESHGKKPDTRVIQLRRPRGSSPSSSAGLGDVPLAGLASISAMGGAGG